MATSRTPPMFESDPTGAPFFQQTLQRFARPVMIGLTAILPLFIIVQLAHACASRQSARVAPRHEKEIAIARQLTLAPRDRWSYSSISMPSKNVDKSAVTAHVGESVLLGPYSIMFTMAMPVGTDTGVDYMARVTIATPASRPSPSPRPTFSREGAPASITRRWQVALPAAWAASSSPQRSLPARR